MKITEQFIKGKKGDPELCEDGLFAGESYIAVVDGVTAKTKTLFGGKTGGRAAMEKIIEALPRLPKGTTPEDAFLFLNKAVSTLYNDKTEGSTAAACAIVYNIEKKEIWNCGDCQCMINGEVFLHEKETDVILSAVRSLVLEIARLEGMTDEELLKNDIGREFILPVISKQYLLGNSNSRYGFEVLDGRSLRLDKIAVHKVKDGDTVVLSSDGYPLLSESLDESEKNLARVLKENPLCDGEYSSTKGVLPGSESFDDRTYIKFTV